MQARKLAVAALLGLVGCSGEADAGREQASGDDVADKLEQAADQSGPAAKPVLNSAAAEARQHDSLPPVDQPGSFAQKAMQNAGNAEAAAAATTAAPK